MHNYEIPEGNENPLQYKGNSNGMKKIIKHLIDKVYLTEDGIVYDTDMPYDDWRYNYFIKDGNIFFEGEADSGLDYFRSYYECKGEIKDLTDYLHLIL